MNHQNLQVAESMNETKHKLEQMRRLVGQVSRFGDQQTRRNFVFLSAADLKLFLT